MGAKAKQKKKRKIKLHFAFFIAVEFYGHNKIHVVFPYKNAPPKQIKYQILAPSFRLLFDHDMISAQLGAVDTLSSGMLREAACPGNTFLNCFQIMQICS